MKKTLKDILEAHSFINYLYKKDSKLQSTKFGYAWKRFVEKNLNVVLEERNEKIEDIRIDNALEDAKTREILLDKENIRGYKFSKEGLKNCIKGEIKIIKEFNEKEIEITPYISSFVPDILEAEDKEILKGLILPE